MLQYQSIRPGESKKYIFTVNRYSKTELLSASLYPWQSNGYLIFIILFSSTRRHALSKAQEGLADHRFVLVGYPEIVCGISPHICPLGNT